eukprot:1501196-Prorocentrum_lima.AAC.1
MASTICGSSVAKPSPFTFLTPGIDGCVTEATRTGANKEGKKETEEHDTTADSDPTINTTS